ncbi:leucine rich repeat protein bspa family [Entamoeba histolytica]|uniref:Leucine rich repeat protein bspa family n=1 Tax=Entamoeba histolytica TaxID=5759 RepID=A0A175JXH7_ENTHI|nr:leucine rich repeat protein bspa family [Entamoeba histolytica]
MQLGYNEIMIVSKYFKDINDFINLEMGVKRFRGNMERFHFNPIPLNQYSRKLFPNIETFHIYNKEDEIFKEGKIFKYVIWYKVSYSRYLKEKEEMNEYKNIAYTEEDRNTYGNTIPIEVNSLEDFCFYRCNDIQSIEIPTSVIEIGNGCFNECSSLESINIPTSVNEIGDSCFSECSSLESINIPTSVIEIGYGCFAYCTSLTTINIPTSVIEIGNSCFEECSSLTSINIEDVKYISEERIFMNEPMLISIEIPKNLKIINGKNIEKKDINEFNIPSTITKLGDSCFSECYSLTTIEILTSVIEIGKYCFVGCSLTTINIPSSITSFGYGCFYHCGCEKKLKKNKSIPEYCFKK